MQVHLPEAKHSLLHFREKLNQKKQQSDKVHVFTVRDELWDSRTQRALQTGQIQALPHGSVTLYTHKAKVLFRLKGGLLLLDLATRTDSIMCKIFVL